MRKLLLAFHNFPPIPHHPSSQHVQINNTNQPVQIPVFETAFDFATLPIIVVVLLLSVLSISFIFHLRLRSQAASQLREFNNLWAVRVLLVLFITYWAINEIIRLPFFHRRYLFPYLTLSEQDDLCKLHVVFSQGFLEPGFFITLRFIINESIKERNRSEIWSVLQVLLMTLPTLILQIISVFFTPLKEKLASMMIRTSFLTVDGDGNKSMMCTFPLLSSILFGVFAVVYSVSLVLSCWRVVALVINKNMRLRITFLGLTVIISLLVQSFFLGLASFWTGYGGLFLGMFVSLGMCTSVAEIVLVIKPILEALVADGDNCEWNPVVRYLLLVEDRNL